VLRAIGSFSTTTTGYRAMTVDGLSRRTGLPLR